MALSPYTISLLQQLRGANQSESPIGNSSMLGEVDGLYPYKSDYGKLGISGDYIPDEQMSPNVFSMMSQLGGGQGEQDQLQEVSPGNPPADGSGWNSDSWMALLGIASGMLNASNQSGAGFGNVIGGGLQGLMGMKQYLNQRDMAEKEFQQKERELDLSSKLGVLKLQAAIAEAGLKDKTTLSRMDANGDIVSLDVPSGQVADFIAAHSNEGWSLGQRDRAPVVNYSQAKGDMTGAQLMRLTGTTGLDPAKIYSYSGSYDPRTGSTTIDPQSIVDKSLSDQKPMSQKEAADMKAQKIKIDASLVSLDGSIQAAERLASHAGLNDATGIGAWNPMNMMPGSNAANFRADLEQLKASTFPLVMESLRGLGQMTEMEGTKMQNSLANLDTARSPADFKRALMDFVDVLKQKRAMIVQMQGAYSDQQATAQAPAQGQPTGGVRYFRDPKTGQIFKVGG